jgi:hypothetical protein
MVIFQKLIASDAYQPDSKLHFTVKPKKNKNTHEYLNEVVAENLMESEDKHLRSLLSLRDEMKNVIIHRISSIFNYL